jgi:DtxR family Mn-dependent transcriptional regulator
MSDPLLNLVIGLVVVLVGALFFWPEKGLVPRWREMRSRSARVLREDALKHMQKRALGGRRPSLRSIAGSLGITIDQAAEVVADLEKRRLVDVAEEGFELTPEGESVALQVIRAHRLWERFLAEETGYHEGEWHRQAEEQEHALSPEELEALTRSLGNPSHDPHGDPIPTAEGDIAPHRGISLNDLALNTPAQIVHIPDEPKMVAAQIQAEGLLPGMVLRVSDRSPLRLIFWINGEEHLLAPMVAANIAVVPLPEERHEPAPTGEPLWSLNTGEKGEVVMLSPRCRGPERRRLMDLGILPGTVIEADLRSPSGDPTAYRIRDALIALRKEQAEWIRIKPLRMEQTA